MVPLSWEIVSAQGDPITQREGVFGAACGQVKPRGGEAVARVPSVTDAYRTMGHPGRG